MTNGPITRERTRSAALVSVGTAQSYDSRLSVCCAVGEGWWRSISSGPSHPAAVGPTLPLDSGVGSQSGARLVDYC